MLLVLLNGPALPCCCELSPSALGETKSGPPNLLEAILHTLPWRERPVALPFRDNVFCNFA